VRAMRPMPAIEVLPYPTMESCSGTRRPRLSAVARAPTANMSFCGEYCRGEPRIFQQLAACLASAVLCHLLAPGDQYVVGKAVAGHGLTVAVVAALGGLTRAGDVCDSSVALLNEVFDGEPGTEIVVVGKGHGVISGPTSWKRCGKSTRTWQSTSNTRTPSWAVWKASSSPPQR
jgi:hypothetical protein